MMSFDHIPNLKSKVKVIVNRVGFGSGQISLKKAQETIGSDIYWQLPNDYRVMVEVRNNGVPLIEQAPKAPITQSIGDLADALCGAAGADDDDKGGKSKLSLTSRWLSKFSSKVKASVEE